MQLGDSRPERLLHFANAHDGQRRVAVFIRQTRERLQRFIHAFPRLERADGDHRARPWRLVFRHQREIHAILHDAADPPLPAIRRDARKQQARHRHQRIDAPRGFDIALPRRLAGDEVVKHVRPVHGQRHGQAERPPQQPPRVPLSGEHVRVKEIKRLLCVQRFGNRQRRAVHRPSAEPSFARVAQRQAARKIHGNAVDDRFLRRSPVRLIQRGAERLHHRHRADAGDHRHVMPLCPQRLRLLMHIKAIRRIIRQPVNHHQYPHAATSSPSVSFADSSLEEGAPDTIPSTCPRSAATHTASRLLCTALSAPHSPA